MSQVTVTLPTGPGIEATDLVITDIVGVNYDFPRRVVSILLDSGKVRDFDYAVATTVTMTISGLNTTVVLDS